MLEIAYPVDKCSEDENRADYVDAIRRYRANSDAGSFARSGVLPVTMERHETHSLVRLQGELTITSAAEVKEALLAGLAAGTDLHLDLERAEAIDVTVMQLLWAAGREADRTGVALAGRMSEAAAALAREAGFEGLPGMAVEG
jgi:anti-anti-sigma regulatory factor